MNVDISADDLLGTADPATEQDEKTNPLHALQQAIAAMPAVDLAKVAAVSEKLQNGNLEILGTEEERLACAQRIATQIMTESSDT